MLCPSSNHELRGRASTTWTMIFALASSLGHSLAECQRLTDFPEITLETPSKVEVVGFNVPSINYVTTPGVDTTRTVKILSASEEPVITQEDGRLVISSSKCREETISSTENEVSAGIRALGLGTVSMLAAALSTNLGGGGKLALSSAALLPLLLPSAKAAEDEVCESSLELEISIPYDCPYNNFVDGQCHSPADIAEKAVQALFVDFDVAAAEKLLDPDYIQHNPTVPTGAEPVLGFIPVLQESGLGIEVHRTIAEGNLVAFHSTYTNASLFGGDTLVGFDVFRVENGKVQEHWDNLQPLRGPTPSGNTMVDGATMIKYRQETTANKAHAVDMITTLLIEQNGTAIPEFISSASYVQHNPDIADNIDGLVAALTALAEADMLFVYDSIELVVAEGNFVLLGSTGSFGNVTTAFYDLLRIEGGLAVEHWDVLQAIPPAEDFAHTNGKF